MIITKNTTGIRVGLNPVPPRPVCWTGPKRSTRSISTLRAYIFMMPFLPLDGFPETEMSSLRNAVSRRAHKERAQPYVSLLPLPSPCLSPLMGRTGGSQIRVLCVHALICGFRLTVMTGGSLDSLRSTKIMSSEQRLSTRRRRRCGYVSCLPLWVLPPYWSTPLVCSFRGFFSQYETACLLVLWGWYFLLGSVYRNSERKQRSEIQMNFTSRWSRRGL